MSVAGSQGVEREQALRSLAQRRWRVAISLTAAMVAIYFGFVALIAYDKAFLARRITPGLSLGIVLGVFVIVSTWVLTWAYVRWANERYDPELERLRK